MLVIDATIWDNGDPERKQHLGRLGIARISTSAGGDWTDHLYVLVAPATTIQEGGVRESGIVRRHSYQAGWQDLVTRCLEGGDEAAAADDPLVARIAEALLEND